jgi:hypothetical protein
VTARRCFLFLAALAIAAPIAAGVWLHVGDTDGIRTGMTLEEASEVLGEPTTTMHGVTVWADRLRSIAISLDGDGRVMDIRRTPLCTAVRRHLPW